MKPLSDFTILDLTNVPPWSYATLCLAALGAKVIKVEDPLRGDRTRRIPPLVNNESVFHSWFNRGKKSVAIDLKSPKGRESFLSLCKTADGLIHNFRPKVVEDLGISYQRVKRINHRLVYCSITAFGSSSNEGSVGAHDINVMALSGALSLMRDKRGTPVMPGTSLSDFAAAQAATLGMTSGLLQAKQTGSGSIINLSMYECIFPFISVFVAAQLLGTESYLLGTRPRYNIYSTKDGKYVTLGITSEKKTWDAFCKFMGRNDLLERWDDKEAIEEVEAIFRSKSQSDWIKTLFGKIDCFAPVLTLNQAISADLTRSMKLLRSDGIPTLNAPRFLDFDGLTQPPKLGEHTRKILGHS